MQYRPALGLLAQGHRTPNPQTADRAKEIGRCRGRDSFIYKTYPYGIFELAFVLRKTAPKTMDYGPSTIDYEPSSST